MLLFKSLLMDTQRLHGLLIVDKPAGITSREVVDGIQGLFPPHTRIGHAGTLDPLATGVLVIGVGAATRLIEYVQRMAKTYQTRIRLGARSNTDDAGGVIEASDVRQPPEPAKIASVLAGFVGEIRQTPPAFSAARVAGRRAYQLARLGQEVSLADRCVKIHSLDLKEYNYPWLDIEVRCGKGTYIRSLARDLGGRLGCGALVETLRRTRIGPFELGSAVPLDLHLPEIPRHLLALSAAVADLPRVVLQDSEITKLRQGQCIPWLPSVKSADNPAQITAMAAFDREDDLVAVVGHDAGRKVLFPQKVLPKAGFTS